MNSIKEKVLEKHVNRFVLFLGTTLYLKVHVSKGGRPGIQKGTTWVPHFLIQENKNSRHGICLNLHNNSRTQHFIGLTPASRGNICKVH